MGSVQTFSYCSFCGTKISFSVDKDSFELQRDLPTRLWCGMCDTFTQLSL